MYLQAQPNRRLGCAYYIYGLALTGPGHSMLTGPTLKENSTTRRVVLLQMRRNKHSTQAHTATHNPPKGGLCVLTANHLTVVGLHQNKNSEVLRRNKHRTAATTCNKYKLLLQHTSNTIANNTTQPKGLGCVFYINSLTGIDAGIK